MGRRSPGPPAVLQGPLTRGAMPVPRHAPVSLPQSPSSAPTARNEAVGRTSPQPDRSSRPADGSQRRGPGHAAAATHPAPHAPSRHPPAPRPPTPPGPDMGQPNGPAVPGAQLVHGTFPSPGSWQRQGTGTCCSRRGDRGDLTCLVPLTTAALFSWRKLHTTYFSNKVTQNLINCALF